MFSFNSRNLVVAWLFLFSAIAAEVAGTTFMANASRGDSFQGYLLMAAALAASYYLLSQAIGQISIGIAYAVWEGVGLASLSLVSVLVFKEELSHSEMLGLGLVMMGIVCVALGEES
ncbi:MULTISPECIES: DMT family transporter [Roseateles]|uniref:Spermidine export protein MdtJ n=1 Tax=Roseateles albus TaxID=2987525 RepID=A0ABT5K847_9BURK|nr:MULTISPECIES: SMR family transporter [Roseateles]MCV2358590.1 QacE family quaternary ammonium compound efflux SMR transporter [Paucibacter sp. TC2R-5]MDC8769945.1 SMR family transporter [Roseateles albus]